MSPNSRFVLPILASVLVVAMAPFTGLLQLQLRENFPDRYEGLLGIVFVLGFVLLLWPSVSRIWTRRSWRRFALLLAGLTLVALQVLVWNRSDARINAVERIHFLYYGALAFLWYRAFRAQGSAWAISATLLVIVAVGTVDEWVQWLVPVRTGDFLDVVLNAYAGVCGLLVSIAVLPLEPLLQPSRVMARKLSTLGIGVTLLFAMFFHQVHLGYEICDSELDSCFLSGFARQELEALARSKTAEWQATPPPRSRTLSLEDPYHSEGMWRVLGRRSAARSLDLDAVFKENQILEKYFDPFLVLSDRLPERRLQELVEERPGLEASPYKSPVFVEVGRRLFIRPSKPLFWALVVALLILQALPWFLRSKVG